MDAEQLRDFFNTNTSKDRTKDTATILSVEGRLYPVDIFYVKGKDEILFNFMFDLKSFTLIYREKLFSFHFHDIIIKQEFIRKFSMEANFDCTINQFPNVLADPVADYVKAVVDTALKIHESEETGDILAFLTGMEEVDRAVSLLNEHARLVKEGRREYPISWKTSHTPIMYCVYRIKTEKKNNF